MKLVLGSRDRSQCFPDQSDNLYQYISLYLHRIQVTLVVFLRQDGSRLVELQVIHAILRLSLSWYRPFALPITQRLCEILLDFCADRFGTCHPYGLDDQWYGWGPNRHDRSFSPNRNSSSVYPVVPPVQVMFGILHESCSQSSRP